MANAPCGLPRFHRYRCAPRSTYHEYASLRCSLAPRTRGNLKVLMNQRSKVTLKKVRKLLALFQMGKIPTLTQHEVHPGLQRGSRENYLYFTLPPCLNFQRHSPAMWASALKTYSDKETRYLFSPEEVVRRPRGRIQKDLLKHKLALQLNKHTDIWIAICKTLHTHFQDDPRVLLASAEHDVPRILDILQNEHRKEFPYLSGPKMANYWLYILSQYTDAKFKRMEELSIIPDTHVLQSTVQLGLSKKLETPLEASRLWKELLVDSGIAPVHMHPVLWNWSRNNFKPEV
jgi:hypothetical protein